MKTIPRPLLDPWVITPEGMQLALEVVRPGLFPAARVGALEALGLRSQEDFAAWLETREAEALSARDAPILQGTKGVEVRSGVAIVSIKGPLARYADAFADISAMTSYARVRKDFQRCMDAPEVRAILFLIDSPGGEVNGCAELADAIYKARGVKPMCAFIGGTGASGAYWLACAVGEIYCARTASLGSIGVVITMVDDSKADEMMGVRTIYVTSSQSPNKRIDPADDASISRVRARADAIAAVFVSDVAKYRGVAEKKVLDDFGQGDVMVGAAAVAAGLADGLSDFETVLADLAGRAARYVPTSPTQGAHQMDSKILSLALGGLPDNATDSQIEARAQQLTQGEHDLLTATGARSTHEAVGKIAAWRAGVERFAVIEAEREVAAGMQRRVDLGALITSAVKDQRVTLGEASSKLLAILDEPARGNITKAIAAAAGTQDVETIAAAFASVDVSASNLERARSYVAASKPGTALPAPRREPPDDKQSRAGVSAVTDEQARGAGFKDAADFARFNVKSVVDIKPAATQSTSGSYAANPGA